MVEILTTEFIEDTAGKQVFAMGEQGETGLMEESYLRVHNLPQHVQAEELAESAVIVIDLLRATSTICTALASGATEVVPILEIDEALAASQDGARSEAVLGGERHGGKIPGFDVGNSPAEFTPQSVGGKRVLITTTNGTRALHHARRAKRIIAGSFLNLSAVAASLREEPRINILCAGTNGHPTEEDILAAGAFAAELSQDSPRHLNENAKRSIEMWESLVQVAHASGVPLSDQVAHALRHTRGGRNLIGIGLDHDLVDCARVDQYNIVPEFDVRQGRIMPTSPPEA